MGRVFSVELEPRLYRLVRLSSTAITRFTNPLPEKNVLFRLPAAPLTLGDYQ